MNHPVETQNFSETADRFNITQPTVSKKIKELEKELGTELFFRKSSGVQLTEAGKTLVPWARRLVLDSNNLKDMMAAMDQNISGQLTIACSTTAGKYILPQLASRFHAKNPDVKISILPCVQANIAMQLLSEEADLAVASIEMDQQSLECQYFFTDHITLIVPESHPWSKRTFIEPEDLLGEPILLREPTSGTRSVLKSELSRYDIALEDLNVLMEVGNAEAIVLSVAAGLGVSFVSKMASAYARAWGCVEEVTVKGMDFKRKICIGRKVMGPPNRAMSAFWSFIHTPENADLLRYPEQ